MLLTRISSAKKGTKSLKTTIPESIAEFLELSDKDELEWKMQVDNNERSATIKKGATGIDEATKFFNTVIDSKSKKMRESSRSKYS
jgi:hypothetical protein